MRYSFELRTPGGLAWFGAIPELHELTIGSDPNVADVALPRPPFLTIGRVELTLGMRDGMAWMRHSHHPQRCTVDDLPFNEGQIAAGTHTIGIDTVSLTLTLAEHPEDSSTLPHSGICFEQPPNWSADAEHILRDSDPETRADTDVADCASADAQAAFTQIVAATAGVAAKWRASRDAARDAAWDEFSFFKGNARWASGTALDISEAKWPHAASRQAVCNAALALIASRPWDGDYDEPVAARKDMLAAIQAIMARTA